MSDREKTSHTTSGTGISEAERMAKIRELLVGPALADESARVDQSVARLQELVEEQHQIIVALQSKVRDLEDSRHADMRRVRLSLLGITEALLTDEGELLSRIMRNETLQPKLDIDDERT